MSSTFSSPTDEFGSGTLKATLRQITDIADDKGSYYLMKSNINTINRVIRVFQDKPLVLRGSTNYRLTGNNVVWSFTGNEVMLRTFPLKMADILNFADNTTNTLVTTESDHNLEVDDVTRIMDSRVGEYNGLQTVVAVPSSTTFEIDVPFNGVDGQSRTRQSRIFITSMAKSATSEEIETISLTDGGTNYTDS